MKPKNKQIHGYAVLCRASTEKIVHLEESIISIKIYVRGDVGCYELQHLTRVFFPDAGMAEGYPYDKKAAVVVRFGRFGRMLAALRYQGRTRVQIACWDGEEKPDFALSSLLYALLKQATGMQPPWGLLTGVRPVRLIHDARARGESDAVIAGRFLNVYDVSAAKFKLAMDTANVQQGVLDAARPMDYSLYVSIPFCPSRCSYCSFVSRTIEKCADLVQPYVECLCRELEAISRQARQLSLQLKTIYIGGGTPTSLTAAQLCSVMQCIRDYFPLEQVQEYTVEAGRPDCTDEEKLFAIRQLGASRISINPQTLNDSVLRQIGRRHNAQDIVNCYDIARKVGHTNINMDLIAGLPTDTVEGFVYSLNGVLALQPENITVHTLTLKRASNLVIEDRAKNYADVGRMIEACAPLHSAGYHPYYLYRQKGTLQNLENTGYSKTGFDGLYNIYIMEEVHSIFSAGAGGVTKLKAVGNKKIERIFNFKYPLEYVRDFDEILKRKQGVNEFYGG